MGSLREASVKHGGDLRLVDGLCEVEEAGGGRSPHRAKEVQGTLGKLAAGCSSVGALVLTHPVLSVSLIELLFVAEGVAFVTQKIQELGEAGVVLVKKEI